MKTLSRTQKLRRGIGASVATLTWAMAASALALPTNPVVVGSSPDGTGAVFTGGSGTLTVTQDSSRVVIDWDSFDIGTGETVTFVQPNSNAISFNRIDPSVVTTIDGALNANGGVWLFSPGGLIIGNGAQVNVGSFFAGLGELNDDQISSVLSSNTVNVDWNAFEYNANLLSVATTAEINATNGFLVLQGANMQIDGTLTASDGMAFLVSEGAQISFNPVAGGETELVNALVNYDPSGRGTPSLNMGGVANAQWVQITGSFANQADYQALINLDGVINATGVKPGGGNSVILELGDATAYPDVGDGTALSHTGAIYAAGDIFVSATNVDMGGLIVGDGSVQIFALEGSQLSGDVYADGNVLFHVEGVGNDFVFSGDIHAGGNVDLKANGAGGTVYVDGAIYTPNQIVIGAAGDIIVGYEVLLHANTDNNGNGSLILSAGSGFDVSTQTPFEGAGSIEISGSATLRAGSGGNVSLDAANGSIYMAGTIEAGNLAQLYAHGTGAEVTINGSITSEGWIFARSEGDLSVGEGAVLSATNENGQNWAIQLAAGWDGNTGNLIVHDGAGLYTGLDANVSDVLIEANGTVGVYTDITAAELAITGRDGVTIDGNLTGKDRIFIAANGLNGVAGTGDVTINSLVSSYGNLTVLAHQGDINISGTGVLYSTGDLTNTLMVRTDAGGDINFAGYITSETLVNVQTIGATGGLITVDGNIEADGRVLIHSNAANSAIDITGDVTSGQRVIISTFGQDAYVTVTGDVHSVDGTIVETNRNGGETYIGGTLTSDSYVLAVGYNLITVGEGAVIRSDVDNNGTGNVLIRSGVGYDNTCQALCVYGAGDIVIEDGAQIEGGGSFGVFVNAHNGDVRMNGFILSDGSVQIFTTGDQGGDIFVRGDIDAAQNVYVFSEVTGDVHQYGQIDAGGDIEIFASGADSYTEIYGNLTADGTIRIAAMGNIYIGGENGAVYITADADGNATGESLIITAGTGYDFDAQTWSLVGDGNVRIDGPGYSYAPYAIMSGTVLDSGAGTTHVLAQNGNVNIDGDISSGADVIVETTGASGGDIGLDAFIDADGAVRVRTTRGDITVVEGSVIASDADDDGAADLTMVFDAGYQAGGSGSVIIEDGATLVAGGETSPDRVSIQASNGIDMAGVIIGSRVSLVADGDIDMSGLIYSTDLVQLISGDPTFADNDVPLVGDITISGSIVAADQVNITTDSGDITLLAGAAIQSDSDGAPTAAVNGEATEDGVFIRATQGTLSIQSGALVSAGLPDAATEGVYIYAGAVDLASGSLNFNSLLMEVGSDIVFDDSWTLDGEFITLRTTNGGDIVVAADVNAGDVTFEATEGGSIAVSGTVYADNDVVLNSVGGDGTSVIDVSGQISAEGSVLIGPASTAPGMAGEVNITGGVSAYDEIRIVSGGDLTVGPDGSVMLLNETGDGQIWLQAGGNGGVDSLLTISAGGGLVRGGADSTILINSFGGLDVAGDVQGGSIYLQGRGEVSVSGGVYAANAVSVSADSEDGALETSVDISGVIRAQDGVEITSENGDVSVSGAVIASADGTVTSTGDNLVIRAVNGVFTLDQAGSLQAGGGEGGITTDISIYAGSADIRGELAFVDLLVEAEGDVYLGAEGGLDGNSVTVNTTAGGDIALTGVVQMVGDVTLYAEQGGSISFDGLMQANGDVSLNSVGNSLSNENSIDVTGSITAGGDILIGPAGPEWAGSLVNQVNVDANLTAGGFIGVRSGGDIYVGGEADLRADSDDNGPANGTTLVLRSGLNGPAGGDITVAEGASLYAGGEGTTNRLLIDARGDVDFAGFASAGGMQVVGYGDVSISGSLYAGDGVVIVARTEDSPNAPGTSVSITGEVQADGTVFIVSENGGVSVGEGALVQANADGVSNTSSGEPEGLFINAFGGRIVTGEGSLLLAGTETNPRGVVDLYASGFDSSQDGAAIELSGDIRGGVVAINAYEGSILVSGDIQATQVIDIEAYYFFGLTSTGSLTVSGGTTPPPASPAGDEWPYLSRDNFEITIAAADVEIDGSITADAIALVATGGEGQALIGGEDGELGGDFNLSNAEFQNLNAETVVIASGGDGEGLPGEGSIDMVVRDLDIDSDVVKTLVLGTGSQNTLHIAGRVTPSDDFVTDLWLGGVVGADGDMGALSFIPGTVLITGGLGTLDNPFQNVSILAFGDVLMGSEAFVAAAAEDPEFDAAQQSDEFEIDEGHIFVAGYSLRIGANGRIIQQNTAGEPGAYAGIWARAPYQGNELIWAPAEIEGLEIGGEDGFTISFAEGPEDVQLFGRFVRENEQGQLEEISGTEAAQLEHLVDADIVNDGGWELNSCEIGGDACAGATDGDDVPRFENPTEVFVDEQEEEEAQQASDTAAGASRADRRDLFRTLIAPESDRAYQQERMGEPVTGSGNEDLWTGRDVGEQK